MAAAQLNQVFEHIRSIVAGKDAVGVKDADLLRRYVQQRDETAFETLVRRHGPMVFGVCRRVLHDLHDAEDAFQATFLVLVRKASSLRSPGLLGNWLYGVAHRTALEARKAAATRRAKEEKVPPRPDAAEDAWADLLPVLDQELTRLPDKYRAVIVLCDLEGKTRSQAARHFGCAEGTAASRLARGRAMLAKRLARHGLSFAGAALAMAFSRQAASAAVPAALGEATVQAAAGAAAGKVRLISAKVVALTEGVLKAMSLTRLQKILSLFLAVALVAGAGLLLHRASANKPSEKGRVPIYLHPKVLAEAKKPTTELTGGGGGFWRPGPERLYGWAVRDLHNYLQRTTRAEYPLTAFDKDATSGIFAGTFDQFPHFKPQGAEAQKAFAAPDPEAFVVEVQGDKLFVLGKTPSGLIAGIYTLLDKLGCKWFAPGKTWENVPERTGLVLDRKLNTASAGPSYLARHFFPSWGPNSHVSRKGARERDYALWCLRNRLGGSAYTANFHNSPILPASLFKERPELFALVKGKRNPQELARGNPEAVGRATEIAVNYLRANEGKGSFYDSFSVEPGDGVPACEESLKKVGNHTPTDLDFWFANQVATGIEKAGLKDKWVGLDSYSDHAGVPSFDLHPRVAVTVTTGLDFSSGGLTVEQRLDGLRKRKARRLGIYEYLNLVTWSLEKPGCHPASDPLLVAANLKRYYEHGARTYMAETSDSWVHGGPGHYLAGRLLWDVRSDPSKELDAYYQGAFGPAGHEIRALYEEWSRLPLKVKMPPNTLPGLPRISRGKCAQWQQHITAAERLVRGQPLYRARLNAVKRYYLYLNLWREFELDLTDPKLPSREERYLRLLRYVGSNRGEGAFHALGLFPTLLMSAPQAGLSTEKWPKAFQAISRNITDASAWNTFPPLSDAQIDRLFAAARLPLDAPAAGGTFDPRLKVFPAGAKPPAELRFPKLHGPPAVARQYVLKVEAPTKLTFEVVAGSPFGGGMPERTCVVEDSRGREIKRFAFQSQRPVRFEIPDLKPGVYTATFPEFGAEQVTVRGGNTFGAVRAFQDTWGFNPMRRSDQKDGEPATCYFAVPAGRASVKVALSEGQVSLGFKDGPAIASNVRGAARQAPKEFKIPVSDTARMGYIRWAKESLTTVGLMVEGVTLFSPDPSSVLYESLD